MTSICFFAAYFNSDDLPYYVEVYLTELKKHFNEVVLLCSRPTLSEAGKKFIASKDITLSVEVNEGFDFGLWYKAFQVFDVSSYDKIALVNDSCILFKPLDEFMTWANTHPENVKGITRSEAIFPHLQSYFLILDKKAISLTTAYFEQHKIRSDISDVIQTYEVGLSKYWQQNQLKISAFIDNNGYTGEFSPYYQCVIYHLEKGIPLIKKKILFSSYRKDEIFTLARMNFIIQVQFYIDLIKRSNARLLLDFEKLKLDITGEIKATDRIRFYFLRFLVNLKKRFYKKHV